MLDFEIFVYNENVVAISCFHTFLIFIQSYILFILNEFFYYLFLSCLFSTGVCTGCCGGHWCHSVILAPLYDDLE